MAMTPAGVEVMRQHGHEVLVEKGAGTGSGFGDEAISRRAPSWRTRRGNLPAGGNGHACQGAVAAGIRPDP